MRKAFTAAGLASLLIVAACEQAAEEAPPAAEAPAAPTYTGRQQVMYQGQEQILAIKSASVEQTDGGLRMTVTGEVGSPGYTRQTFLRRIYAAPPQDGIYEFDVVADAPAEPQAQVVTPIEVTGVWAEYDPERVKGVRFIGKTNDMVAMVGGEAAAAQ